MKEETDPLAQFVMPERLERIESVLEQRTSSLTVVLDRVHKPHNISAVLRSADAFGLTDIHLIADRFAHSPDISLGSERWINIRSHKSPELAAKALCDAGFKLAALQSEEKCANNNGVESMPVTELPFEKRLALVFGNEVKGISPELQERVEFSAYIPMSGFVDSLNISVACAVCLFCSTISKTEPKKRPPGLAEDEKAALRKAWLAKSVGRSEIILREIAEREKRQMKTVRIAAAQGFWGDWLEAPVNQIKLGNVDYLMLDYLAEVTMSILSKQKERDEKLGYAAQTLFT